MPMDRYFCHLCNSIVRYGEMDPCFFNKNDDKVYTVPPPNESEATERKDVQLEEIHPANLNDQSRNSCPAAQQNYTEGSNETASLMLGNKRKISPLPSSRRKRCRFSSLPSKFLSGEKNRHFDSKMVSSTNTERDKNTDGAKNSKRRRKVGSASAKTPQFGHCSTSGMSLSTVAFGPVSVAGPSGNQEQTHKTDRKKPLVCDVCGKAFSWQIHLERHKITHAGEKLLVCGTCGKGFARKDNLLEHLLTHTRPRSFTCEVCGRGFTQESHLAKHLPTHSLERPFECEVCRLRFKTKQKLTIHFRIHTGEKPYTCGWCGKQFSVQSNYKRHKKHVHGEE